MSSQARLVLAFVAGGVLTTPVVLLAAVQASDLFIFANGTVADADQVNANFEALRIAHNELEARVQFIEDPSSVSGTTCASIKAAFPSAPSGAYTIDPTGTGGVTAYCDMTGDGGGWTLFAETSSGGTAHASTGQTNIEQMADLSYSGSGTFGDVIREAIGRYYKIECGATTIYGYNAGDNTSVDDHWENTFPVAWATTFSTDPAHYTQNNQQDCGSPTCDGPAYAGRNWFRDNNVGCGIGSSGYGNAGRWWVR